MDTNKHEGGLTSERIAREVAEKWFSEFEPPFEPGTLTPTPGIHTLTAIIQSAIEKAYGSGYDAAQIHEPMATLANPRSDQEPQVWIPAHMTTEDEGHFAPRPSDECKVEGGSSRICEHGTKSCTVQHAPSPSYGAQEWTVIFQDAGFGELKSDGKTIASGGSQMILGIAKHHNASIATEEKNCDEICREWEKRYGELEQQLTDERKANIGLYIESNERYQKLLAALAAIEKMSEAGRELYHNNPTLNLLSLRQAVVQHCKKIKEIRSTVEDLSLLREHDEAVRKPAVDALKDVRKRVCGPIVCKMGDCLKIIDAALANYTERNKDL